jgi:anti-sigma factor RsiW
VTCDEVGRLLGAFVDGELTLSESAAIAEHIDGCPTCDRWRAELESLGRLVRSVPRYTAPKHLRATVAAAGGGRVTQRMLALAAAAAIVVALGAITMRFTRSPRGFDANPAVVEAVVDDHVRALMGEHLLDVPSSDQHTVKPWFVGKLDFSPPVTDLAAVGFSLVGGRLEYVDGRPAAAIIYRRRQHMIDLFVWPVSDGDTAVEARSIRGFQVRHWVGHGMSFWAVSDLNDRELDEFVRALRQ